MKRIVIIEGSVRGIAAESPRQDVLTIDINDVDTDTIAVPSAIGEVIAREAYRKNVRVVVEIGTEEAAVGSLASASREELIHALAAARHAADEYRRENEALVKSSEGLRADLDTMRTKNNEMHRALAVLLVAFDPEKHITKATVYAELLKAAAAQDAIIASDDIPERYAHRVASNALHTLARKYQTKETP